MSYSDVSLKIKAQVSHRSTVVSGLLVVMNKGRRHCNSKSISGAKQWYKSSQHFLLLEDRQFLRLIYDNYNRLGSSLGLYQRNKIQAEVFN